MSFLFTYPVQLFFFFYFFTQYCFPPHNSTSSNNEGSQCRNLKGSDKATLRDGVFVSIMLCDNHNALGMYSKKTLFLGQNYLCWLRWPLFFSFFFFFLFFFFLFCFLGCTHGIWKFPGVESAAVDGLHHSRNNKGSEPHL